MRPHHVENPKMPQGIQILGFQLKCGGATLGHLSTNVTTKDVMIFTNACFHEAAKFNFETMGTLDRPIGTSPNPTGEEDGQAHDESEGATEEQELSITEASISERCNSQTYNKFSHCTAFVAETILSQGHKPKMSLCLNDLWCMNFNDHPAAKLAEAEQVDRYFRISSSLEIPVVF